jgi:hypothetical protein
MYTIHYEGTGIVLCIRTLYTTLTMDGTALLDALRASMGAEEAEKKYQAAGRAEAAGEEAGGGKWMPPTVAMPEQVQTTDRLSPCYSIDYVLSTGPDDGADL